jgi:hypothetical protein
MSQLAADLSGCRIRRSKKRRKAGLLAQFAQKIEKS